MTFRKQVLISAMQMRQTIQRFFIPVVVGAFIAAMAMSGSSCRKEQLLQSGGELRFSTDTLTFDTVFTSLGSATVGIKIFNPQKEKVNISSVRLAGGSTSYFRLNVDGKSGEGKDIELAGNDSLYVFATVKVDPTDQNTPFVVEDRLIASLNGKDFSIPVMAYGQNAHYIRDSVLRTDTWLTDKPYVIIGGALVDEGQKLNIPAGCRIYMHANARLFVAGTLEALGTKKDSIIFQGNRLDRSYFGYEGYPGEWGGIYFTSYSTANVLRHVIIRNCGNGAQGAPPAAIQLAPDSVLDAVPQLTMDRCTVENSIAYGVLSFGGTLKAENCLIHSCGANAIALVQGGNYELNNCTFATYGNSKISHTDNPVAVIYNFYYYTQTKFYAAPLTAVLHNCVVAGSLENEFLVDSVPDYPASIQLNNCLLKMDDETKIPSWVGQSSVRYTKADGILDPRFTDITKTNYRPKDDSPLIDGGADYTGISLLQDLDDKPRRAGLAADIGCYEVK